MKLTMREPASMTTDKGSRRVTSYSNSVYAAEVITSLPVGTIHTSPESCKLSSQTLHCDAILCYECAYTRDVRVQILIWFQTFLLFTKPHFLIFWLLMHWKAHLVARHATWGISDFAFQTFSYRRVCELVWRLQRISPNQLILSSVCAVLFTCVLTSMQNFAAIGRFGAEIWRGGQIDPPPSKNLLSKSPVKIGLMHWKAHLLRHFRLFQTFLTDACASLCDVYSAFPRINSFCLPYVWWCFCD